MNFTKICTLLIVLFALPLAAQEPTWTEFEKVELLKVVESYEVFASLVPLRLGTSFENQQQPESRAAYAQALRDLSALANASHEVLGMFFNSPKRVDTRTREEAVARGKDIIAGLGDTIERVEVQVGLIPEEPLIEHVLSVLAKTKLLLASFDMSLPYSAFAPVDFPAIVFPHGDYFTAQNHFVRTGRYGTGHVARDISKLIDPTVSPLMSPEAQGACSRAIRNTAKVWVPFIRAWGLSAGIMSQRERELIEAEFENSGKTRPISFFVNERQWELLLSGSGSLILPSGRRSEIGMPAKIFAMNNSFVTCQAALIAVNGGAWAAECWTPGNAGFSDRPALLGACANYIGDLADFWKDTPDGWAWATLGRFHGPFGPPPGSGPPPECPELTPSVDVVLNGVPVICEEEK